MRLTRGQRHFRATFKYYYRIIISPDPRREDRYKDLDLRNLTIATMLKLEERYGKPI